MMMISCCTTVNDLLNANLVPIFNNLLLDLRVKKLETPKIIVLVLISGMKRKEYYIVRKSQVYYNYVHGLSKIFFTLMIF